MNIDFKAEMPILRTSENQEFQKSNFPINLLHCGISPITQRAFDAIALYNQEVSTDPISTFFPRIQRIQKTREAAANLLGTESPNIAFVKSTTHGLLLMAHSIKWNEGDIIIVEESTFPANFYTWKELEKRYGVKVVFWPERNYRYELDDLEKLLKKHSVRMVSVSAADYGTGFRHDLNAVGSLVKNHGSYFGVDGIQAVGAVPLNVKECQADFLSADGHKWMLAPEGAGILYVAPNFIGELDDAFAGWIGRQNFTDYGNRNLPAEDNARRFEEGALNFAGILALGGSLSLINEVGIEKAWDLTWENREIIHQWGTEKGLHPVSPLEKKSSVGTISFQYEKAKTVAEEAGKLNVHISNRRGLLRFAPHFYQSTELVQEGLRRIQHLII